MANVNETIENPIQDDLFSIMENITREIAPLYPREIVVVKDKNRYYGVAEKIPPEETRRGCRFKDRRNVFGVYSQIRHERGKNVLTVYYAAADLDIKPIIERHLAPCLKKYDVTEVSMIMGN